MTCLASSLYHPPLPAGLLKDKGQKERRGEDQDEKEKGNLKEKGSQESKIADSIKHPIDLKDEQKIQGSPSQDICPAA
jgi:hypothetical protein